MTEQLHRTFDAPKEGVYLVTVPFKSGDAPPCDVSYQWPNSWHPDGKVRSIVQLVNTMPEHTGTRELHYEDTWRDQDPSALPPAPVVTIDQGVPGWVFETVADDWRTENTGVYAKRECRARLVSPEGNACDFFLVYTEEFWAGKLVRWSRDLFASRPDELGKTQRNFPIHQIQVDGVPVSDAMSVADGMRYPFGRYDELEYARCHQWDEFDSGPYGGNRIRESIEYGGKVEDQRTPEKLISEGEAQLARPWYGVSEYCHPHNGAGQGLHGDFGAHSEDTFTRFDTDVAKALHYVLGHYDAYIYHNRTMEGAPQRRQDSPDNYSNSPLGELEKGPRPWFGKVKEDEQGNPCEEPNRRDRKNEDNAHMDSVKLVAALELCPAPWLLDGLEDRANAMQFFPEPNEQGTLPQVRSNWRAITSGLGMIPFIEPGTDLNEEVFDYMTDIAGNVIDRWESSGNKPYDWKRPTEHCSLVGALEAIDRSGYWDMGDRGRTILRDVASYCLWHFWKAFGDDGVSDWRVLYGMDPETEDGEKEWDSGTNGGQPLGMFLHWMDQNYGWPEDASDVSQRVTVILMDQRDDRLCRWLPQPLKVTEPDPPPPNDTNRVIALLAMAHRETVAAAEANSEAMDAIVRSSKAVATASDAIEEAGKILRGDG